MATEGKITTLASGKRGINASGKAIVFDAAGAADCCSCGTCNICGCGDRWKSKIRVIIDITETFYASNDGTGTPTRTLTEQRERELTGWLEGNDWWYADSYWPGDRVEEGERRTPLWDFVFSNATLPTWIWYVCSHNPEIRGYGICGGWLHPRLISLPFPMEFLFWGNCLGNFAAYDPFDIYHDITLSKTNYGTGWDYYLDSYVGGDPYPFAEEENSANYALRIRMSCVESAPTCEGCQYDDSTLAAATFTLTGEYRQTGYTELYCSGDWVPASIIDVDGPHHITKTPGEELTIGGKKVPGATFASSIYFPDVGSYLRVDKIYWSCTTGSWHMVMTSPGSAGDILNLFPDEAGVADIDIGGGNCSGFNITMIGCYNYPIVEGEQTTGPNGELSTHVELDLYLITDFACDVGRYIP